MWWPKTLYAYLACTACTHAILYPAWSTGCADSYSVMWACANMTEPSVSPYIRDTPCDPPSLYPLNRIEQLNWILNAKSVLPQETTWNSPQIVTWVSPLHMPERLHWSRRHHSLLWHCQYYLLSVMKLVLNAFLFIPVSLFASEQCIKISETEMWTKQHNSV